MKKLTLGARLGLSFGALIVLISVFGGLAIWRIKLAAGLADHVAIERAPEVRAAYDVHDAAWKTRFYVRSYALTGNEDYLRKARPRLATLKERLKAADDLAAKFPDLTALDKGEMEAMEKTLEFEALIDKLEAEYKHLALQIPLLDTAARQFMQNCLSMRASQLQSLNTELEEKVEVAKLKERVVKLGLIEDCIELGNALRVANYKAQAAGNIEGLGEAIRDFGPLENTIARLEPLVKQQVNLDQLAAIRAAGAGYRAAMEKVQKSSLAITELASGLANTADGVTGKAAEVADGGLQAIELAAKEVAGTLSSTSLILIMGLAISLVVGNLVAWRSTRAITAPISEGVSALSTTASHISATIAQLAYNASETAAAVSETTTTVDEVRQTSQVAADRAKAVADSAKGAALAAETGRKATEQTVEGLNLIRDQMGSIGESITRLNEQSQAVGDIVSTVADLAEQSNLLAVNASIEAAKAGEAGKGFAVVAQEIRNLAEQSKDSTKQVRAILTEVQKATGKAVVASEQGVKIVADGSQQADEAGQAIASLTSTVQDSTRAAVQIAASSQQQLIGMEQVGRAMENIKNATAQNAEGARQLGTAAHNLQEIGARLKALISSDNNGGVEPRRK